MLSNRNFICNNYWLWLLAVKSSLLIGILFWPSLVWASPAITAVNLNGGQSATFDPKAGEQLTIDLTAGEAVKFSTVAICAMATTDCSRTTAVKYFTQATKYDTAVEKVWDGKTGGSNPDYVPDGNYRLVITIANQAGDKSDTDLSQNIITVASSVANSSSGDNGNTSTSTESGGATTTAVNINENAGVVDSGPAAVYSSYGSLSNYNQPIKLSVGLGRRRLTAVGNPITFKALTNNSLSAVNYRFSFGDGSGAVGQTVYHSYSFPGVYRVVLTAGNDSEEVVADTNVEVVPLEVSIKEFLPQSHKVVLHNNSIKEVNVGGFRLAYGGVNQVLAEDTIIKSGGDLAIYVTGQLAGDQSITLQNRFGNDLSTAVGRPVMASLVEEKSVDVLAKEELALATGWEKQFEKTAVKNEMIVPTKMIAKEVNGDKKEELEPAVSSSSIDIERVASPTQSLNVKPKSLAASVALSQSYKVEPPRAWWREVIKWTNGIFHP